MKPNSVGDLIIRLHRIVHRWGWSLAMSAALEVRDEHDRFIVSGSVPEIATIIRQEASYRAHKSVA